MNDFYVRRAEVYSEAWAALEGSVEGILAWTHVGPAVKLERIRQLMDDLDPKASLTEGIDPMDRKRKREAERG